MMDLGFLDHIFSMSSCFLANAVMRQSPGLSAFSTLTAKWDMIGVEGERDPTSCQRILPFCAGLKAT
jgi:hypothetical protein